MARKPRLQYPGAQHHVVNRGNFKYWIFRDDRAKTAFEACLFEVCESHHWRLHAYVLMGNHFHLAIETPEGNLTSGMQWLQATFASRFNRFRKQSGHLFQGRFYGPVLEPGKYLGQVCHYIHMNPVRAGVVGVPELRDYRYSSYWYLHHGGERKPFMRLQTCLDAAGGLADSPEGLRAYEAYLEWQAAEGPAGKNKAYACLSKGWALGSKEFKRNLLADSDEGETLKLWDQVGQKEAARLKWEERLQALRPYVENERDARLSAPWKVALACVMKESTSVSNGWLAETLGMGSGVYVSKHVGLARDPGHPVQELVQRLRKVKGKT